MVHEWEVWAHVMYSYHHDDDELFLIGTYADQEEAEKHRRTLEEACEKRLADPDDKWTLRVGVSVSRRGNIEPLTLAEFFEMAEEPTGD